MSAKQKTVKVTLTDGAMSVLEDMQRFGIYGASKEEVCLRILDKAFETWLRDPVARRMVIDLPDEG